LATCSGCQLLVNSLDCQLAQLEQELDDVSLDTLQGVRLETFFLAARPAGAASSVSSFAGPKTVLTGLHCPTFRL